MRVITRVIQHFRYIFISLLHLKLTEKSFSNPWWEDTASAGCSRDWLNFDARWHLLSRVKGHNKQFDLALRYWHVSLISYVKKFHETRGLDKFCLNETKKVWAPNNFEDSNIPIIWNKLYQFLLRIFKMHFQYEVLLIVYLSQKSSLASKSRILSTLFM